MILVGSQRGGGKDLAIHLEKPDNDHVQIHEIRGFTADTLLGAFTETHAISRATRCKQYLFSLSVNPPEGERVGVGSFEQAIEQAEHRLGLQGQPRAIVFHEKEGRRHAHAVWSRIDTNEMKAVHHSFYKEKLRTLSRELFLEHGWKLPDGHAERSKSDPTNFTLAEWQQAKRAGKDARTVKTAFQDAWAISDSRAALAHALKERGYMLARGDRRGFVGVDVHGEVYSVPRQIGVKTKDVRERLGNESELPSVEEAKAKLADLMNEKMKRFRQELDAKAKRRKEQFKTKHAALLQRQKAERNALSAHLNTRQKQEAIVRQARFSTGLRGVWDVLRGEHKRIRQQNEQEAYSAFQRDRAAKDDLVYKHIGQRKRLDLFKLQVKERIEATRKGITQDIRTFEGLKSSIPKAAPEPKRRASRSRLRNRGPTPDF